MTQPTKILTGVLAVLVTLVLIPKSVAMPQFARKYGTSCQTCHISYPKLNAVGEAFRRNGFRFPGDAEEEAVKNEPVSLGAEAYKKMFPKAVWPGKVPATIPIGIAVEGELRGGEADEIKGDIQFPQAVKLLAAGTLSEKFSFWFGMHLIEGGSIGTPGRVYLQVNDLLGGVIPQTNVHLRLGQFDPDVVQINSHRILGITPIAPQAYNTSSGLGAGHAHSGGGFSLDSLQRGVETRGTVAGRIIFAAGLVNGNGAGEQTHHGSFDNDNYKDTYGRLAIKLFGLRADGLGQSSDNASSLGNALDNTIQIGGFAYRGRGVVALKGEEDEMHMEEEAEMAMEEEEEETGQNGFRRAGVDLLCRYGPAEVRATYLISKDDDPHGEGEALEAEAYSVQGQFIVFPWLIVSGRWEQVLFEHELDDVTRFIPNLTMLVRANVRVTAEAIITPDETKNEIGILRVGYAF